MCIVVEPFDKYVTLPGILIALAMDGIGGLVYAIMLTAWPSAMVLAATLTA